MHCNESEPPHPAIWHRRCVRCDTECNWQGLTGEICVNLLSQVKDRGLMFLWKLISSVPCSDHLKIQWKCEVQSWIISTLASYLERFRCKLRPRDWFFSLNFMIILVSSTKMLGLSWNLATSTSSHVLTNSLFTNHLAIRRYVAWNF